MLWTRPGQYDACSCWLISERLGEKSVNSLGNKNARQLKTRHKTGVGRCVIVMKRKAKRTGRFGHVVTGVERCVEVN